MLSITPINKAPNVLSSGGSSNSCGSVSIDCVADISTRMPENEGRLREGTKKAEHSPRSGDIIAHQKGKVASALSDYEGREARSETFIHVSLMWTARCHGGEIMHDRRMDSKSVSKR